MAVAFDAVGPTSAGASSQFSTTLSWSHTCTGSDLCLIVAVALNNNTAGSGETMTATYNGVSMTSIGSIPANNQNAGYVQMWRLIAPATGAHTVAITASGATPQSLVGGSVSLTGVHQTTPVGTPVTAFGTTGTASAVVTGTTAGNMVIDAVCNGASVTSSTKTNRWLKNDNTFSAAGNAAQSTAAAGGSVTMSYSVTADWFGIIAVEVKASAGGGTQQTTADLYPNAQTTTGTTWANQANALGSTTGNTATRTTTTSGAVGTFLAAGYDAQTAMGGVAPTSIDSISCTINEYVTGAAARYSSLTAQLYSGTTPIGTAQALTISTTTTNSQTLTFTSADLPTWAQCADLRVNLSGTKSGTQASVWNIDTVGPLAITYTVPSVTTLQGAATLTATASLTTAGIVEKVGAVSLAATTTLTSAGRLDAFGAVALSATKTLTVGAFLTAQAAISLASTTTLTVTPPPIVGAVSLTTSQTLTAAGSVSQPASATLSATSSLTVGVSVQGMAAAASLIATAALSTTGTLGAFAATSLVATTALSVVGIRMTDGAVTLSAIAVLSTAGFLTEFAAVSLSVGTTLSTAGRLGAFGAVSMAALGVLSATVGGIGGAVALTISQSLSVTGAQLTEVATVALSTVATLVAAGVRASDGSVTLSAVPVLTAGVSVRVTNGAATLAALGTLTADGIRIANVVAGGVPLVAVGVLSVNGSAGGSGGANLIATALLTSSGIRIVIGATQLTALPSLIVSGIAVEFGAVALGATVVLSADGTTVKIGAVSMTAIGLLLGSAAIRLAGAVNLVALPNLVFIELFPTVDVLAMGDWAIVGAGLHRDRPPYERPKSGWTTDGIHVGSVRS